MHPDIPIPALGINQQNHYRHIASKNWKKKNKNWIRGIQVEAATSS
jgi:hypothetical protein